MDIWFMIILPILVVGVSLVVASYLTPLFVFLIDTYGGRLIRKLLKTSGSIVVNQSEQYTAYYIGSSYIPQPIKNIMDKLNIFKKFIKHTREKR